MPRILVVDDEQEVCDLLSRFLERNDYTVVTARTGAECLSIVERDSIDAVLLDLKMPGMTGLEVLRKLRTINPDLPVVMITGQTDEQTAKATLEEGAFDYIKKPLDFDYLQRTLYVRLAQQLL